MNPEKFSTPEQSDLDRVIAFGKRIHKNYEDFAPLISKEDYPEYNSDLLATERMAYREKVMELQRLSKQTPLVTIFPIAEQYMQTIEELNALKIGDTLLNEIAAKAAKEKDLDSVEFDIKLSKMITMVQGDIDTVAATFVHIREAMKNYEENYQFITHSESLAEADTEIRGWLSDLKIHARRMANMIEDLAVLIKL